MNAWWYADKGKKKGPVQMAELRRLLQTATISHQTMVWHEGMEAWRHLDDVHELSDLTVAVAPPLPPIADTDSQYYLLSNRWPRFFARSFDVWLEMLFVSLSMGFALSLYFIGFVEWIKGPGASQLFGILCLPIALTLDAFLYRFIGNTPGKALLGLKLTTPEGNPLSFAQYLSRNISMWASGLALGVPLINLFTMASQYRRLGKGLQASYDELEGFRVRAKPSGWLRKTSFGFAFFGLIVIIGALTLTEQAIDNAVILSSAKQDFYVSDKANILTIEQANEIGVLLSNHNRSSFGYLRVLVIPQLPASTSIEDYSNVILREDLASSEGRRDRVLLIVALKERVLRIEASTAVGPVLSDEFCKQVIDSEIVPQFRQGRFFLGIKNGLNMLIAKLNAANPYRPG